MPDNTIRQLWSNIPKELRDRPQWCLAGPDSRPLQLNEYNASSTAPGTWTDYESVCKRAIEIGQTTGTTPYIGYVLSKDDPYTCIDLDVKNANSRNKKTGEPYPEEQWTTPEQIDRFNKIIENFDSYTEVSSGGLGIHIWIKGNIGPGVNRDNVEVYSQEHFIVCTGCTYIDKPITDKCSLLQTLITEISGGSKEEIVPTPDSPQIEDDGVILRRAYGAENSQKFKDLFEAEGGWKKPEYKYPSQSQADMALIVMLVFYSPNNEQVKRLFLGSALGRTLNRKSNPDYYITLTIHSARKYQAKDREKKAMMIESLKPMVEVLEANYKKLLAESAAKENVIEIGNPPVNDLAVKKVKEELQQHPPMIPPPPGLAGQLAYYIYSSSILPIPEAAIAGTLGLLGGICGKAWATPGDPTGLNLYLILVARSATGKEGMYGGINRLMDAAASGCLINLAKTEFIEYDEAVSRSALMKLCIDRHSFVNLNSEFGKRFAEIVSPKALTNERQLRAGLLKLYSKSGPSDMIGGLRYSDKEKSTTTIGSVAFSR